MTGTETQTSQGSQTPNNTQPLRRSSSPHKPPFTSGILCGDAAALLQRFPPQSIDFGLTDAPYLVNYQDRDGRSVRNDNNPEAVLPVFPQLYRVLKPHSYCVVFCGWAKIADFARTWQAAGFSVAGEIVWTKDYASSARHVAYRHESAYVLTKGNPQRPAQPLADVRRWEYSGNRRHPTEKAVNILTPLVRAFSKPGDVVLDPFTGSGAIPVAAALSGRRAIGIDIERQYCDMARRRLAGARRYAARRGA